MPQAQKPEREQWLYQGGRNSSFQFDNTRWQHPGSATVNSVSIAILFENKVH